MWQRKAADQVTGVNSWLLPNTGGQGGHDETSFDAAVEDTVIRQGSNNQLGLLRRRLPRLFARKAGKVAQEMEMG
jgi:hypothetical protein